MDSLVPPSRDQFERIKHVQEEKEEAIRRRTREQRRLQRQRGSSSPSEDHELLEAACVIQKTFRGYRARRELSGFTLDASTRWVTAIREAQFRETTRPRGRSLIGAAPSLDTLTTSLSDDFQPSTARFNWKKVSMVARRAGHDDCDDISDYESDLEELSPQAREEAKRLRHEANTHRRETALTLGIQYWLEIVDLKHRYGTNLRMYHEEWTKADTNENFFYWLDYGEGRNISLDVCPREKLEQQQVRYLSREERQFYLVEVDHEGRLCWAKNGEPIDTSDMYRDSIHGIVPKDDPTPAYYPPNPQPFTHASSVTFTTSSATSASSFMSKRDLDQSAKYPTPGPDEGGLRKVKQLSATTTLNKLLRKTVKDGTWIFVADTSFRLYVGIKQAGTFQHSSFLQGGRISAGGLIGIKEGKLKSLSPLSGHYRPPTANFRAFIKSLKVEGVDVGHVPMSKAYAVLLGLETYTKTRRMGLDLVNKMVHRKDKIVHPEQVQRRQEEEKDTSKSAEKERAVLAREEAEADAERHANRPVSRAMQKLHIVRSRGIPSHDI